MADGYLNFDTKINEKGFNDGINKLCGLAGKGVGSIAGIASKANGIFAALSSSVAGVIIKQSLGVVANMEQQVGGVETLFKDSANTVIENANKAYKTAGMSANNYMETVTSFSASLLQSLGGDTAKAASYADRAIVDMSDNANKMGTNMRDIQNAYQGFAKQNYTMLDNLKLGYGGTQEEMKRLISDASKMTDVQKELGVTVDASSLSFGNIVNAISVVQKQMGITGTTSKEAATTIEGSVNSAKAAWENFEVGVISANDLVETFWTAAQNIFKNLGQIIPRLGKTGMDVVSALAGKIGGAVPQVKGFTDSISKLANELKGMNSDQLLNLGKMAVVIAGSAPALSIFGKGIENVKTATEGFNGIADGIISSISKIPKSAENAGAMLKSIGSTFKNLGDSLLLPFRDLGNKIAPYLKLMKGLASGIANSIPIVAAKAPVIIGKLVSTIITNLPKILTAGVQIVSKLAVGLVRGIPALIGKIPSMISQIRNAFTSVNWGSVGMNIVKGIASGLANAGGVIVKAAKSAAKSALDAAKSALGIHSPSRVFRDQVGKMMALGMGIGFEKNIPLKSMNVGVQRAVSGLQKSVDLALSARTVDKTVGRVKSYPGFDGGKDIDYDRLERIQMKAADKLSKRPIYLGTKRIDEPLPKGAVPVW